MNFIFIQFLSHFPLSSSARTLFHFCFRSLMFSFFFLLYILAPAPITEAPIDLALKCDLAECVLPYCYCSKDGTNIPGGLSREDVSRQNKLSACITSSIRETDREYCNESERRLIFGAVIILLLFDSESVEIESEIKSRSYATTTADSTLECDNIELIKNGIPVNLRRAHILTTVLCSSFPENSFYLCWVVVWLAQTNNIIQQRVPFCHKHSVFLFSSSRRFCIPKKMSKLHIVRNVCAYL